MSSRKLQTREIACARLCLLLLSLSRFGTAQTSPAGSAPASPTEQLEAADRASRLDDPTLKPWHLKISVELFDDAGKPKEKGTIEEWWAAPDQYRIIRSSPSYSATETGNGGDLARAAAGRDFASSSTTLLRQFVRPLGDSLPTPDLVVTTNKQTMSELTLKCVSLAPAGKPAADARSYCFDPVLPMLRLSSDSSMQHIIAMASVTSRIARSRSMWLCSTDQPFT